MRAITGTRLRMGRCLGAWCGLCACACIVLMLLPVPQPAHAAPLRWMQATATGHGVQLTLSIRRRSYPQNALVRVWARMENLTGHTLKLYDPGPQAAGTYIPQVVVLRQPGGDPLPISLTDYTPYFGPAPFSRPLSPHAVRNIPELLILRGPLLRLDLTFAVGQSLPPRIGPTVSTPLLRLSLTAPDAPVVVLRVPPNQPGAAITPNGRVRGRLLAVWYYNCKPGYVSSIQESLDWTAISPHVVPTCPPGVSLVGWHEDAGWLNHSVAEIDWGEP